MRILMPLVAVAVLVAVPAQAQGAVRTIRADADSVTRLGGFRPGQDPTLAAAEAVFGPASEKRLIDRAACRVDWRRLRLRILFSNFGGQRPGETTCSPRGGSAQTFTVRGRAFRTWRGLRVGHRSSSIPVRHPAAEFRERSWWLRTAVSNIGEPTEFPVVRAIVSGGRVRAIVGWIGAAGD